MAFCTDFSLFFSLFIFQGIPSALLSKVLPTVQGTCSLLSTKLSYSKHEGMSCDDLWLDICQKRDECDEKIKIMKGVAFFFSSVAALEIRSREKGGNANSQEQEDDHNDNLREKYWPALTGLQYSPPMAHVYQRYPCIRPY